MLPLQGKRDYILHTQPNDGESTFSTPLSQPHVSRGFRISIARKPNFPLG
jgi:hypothetical protein